MSENKTYIIIVTYNGEHFIEDCLNSIQNTIGDYTTIVIDNNSNDNTTQIIKEKFSCVRLIEEKTNLGFGKANNIGLKIALNEAADYVFLLNQDATMENDTIEKLISSYKTYPDYSVLSPIHLNGTKRELDYNFSVYLSPSMCPNIISDGILGCLNPVYTCKFINAAAWFIPLPTLREIGLFDPLFFHYGEDDDYVKRLSFHNKKIGVVTSSKIIHNRPQNKPISKLDKNRKITVNILKLKNLNTGFYYSLCAFTFNSIVKVFTLLGTAKFRELFFSIKLFWKTLVLLPKIKASKKESVKGASFLNS